MGKEARTGKNEKWRIVERWKSDKVEKWRTRSQEPRARKSGMVEKEKN